MGLVSIDIICTELTKYGLDENTLCALVQQGTTDNQRVFTSNLRELPELVKRETKPPTILIIGSVVSLRDKLRWYEGTISHRD